MDNLAFKMDLGIFSLPAYIRWRRAAKKADEGNLHAWGSVVFCGPQGSGKTLSAVQYVERVFDFSPRAILVTNVELKSYPVNAYLDGENVVRYIANNLAIDNDFLLAHFNDVDFVKPVLQYQGLDMLTTLKNGKNGVIYFIDEFHLELNSLESKNIPIEVMTEISQQRKQRVHIVGTSQVFMRLAKPLREQIFNVVLCKCFLGCFQVNKMALGDSLEEKDGKLQGEIKARAFWFHKPQYYEEYDTYAKMKRYTTLWKNSKGGLNSIYE
ncbi:MAG: ATP-binding protein [Clostridiales bacterium]|nr:ATP-binding protein [Clostridiales bacterium]